MTAAGMTVGEGGDIGRGEGGGGERISEHDEEECTLMEDRRAMSKGRPHG